jgi:hypothetical protein
MFGVGFYVRQQAGHERSSVSNELRIFEPDNTRPSRQPNWPRNWHVGSAASPAKLTERHKSVVPDSN